MNWSVVIITFCILALGVLSIALIGIMLYVFVIDIDRRYKMTRRVGLVVAVLMQLLYVTLIVEVT